MKEKLLLAAAALLGFATACNNEEDQPKVVSMYGVPYNNYKIKGKVTDKAGRPIKGIEVRSNAYLPTPEATTAADGTYDLSGKGVGNTARVTLTDTDGPANGGDFAAKTVDIEFTEAERTAKGDGDWDQGAFAKSGVDIALEEKEARPGQNSSNGSWASARWATCSATIRSAISTAHASTASRRSPRPQACPTSSSAPA